MPKELFSKKQLAPIKPLFDEGEIGHNPVVAVMMEDGEVLVQAHLTTCEECAANDYGCDNYLVCKSGQMWKRVEHE